MIMCPTCGKPAQLIDVDGESTTSEEYGHWTCEECANTENHWIVGGVWVRAWCEEPEPHNGEKCWECNIHWDSEEYHGINETDLFWGKKSCADQGCKLCISLNGEPQ